MIVFELTMPGVGSWNGKWTQSDKHFIRCYDQRKVPKEYWNKDFYHHWDDGWTACVSTYQVPAADAKKLEKKSDGFCGYDWMIKSIIKYGEIRYSDE